MKTILLVFAHPDDESFAAGGTVAKYIESGWQVHLLCVTRGEKGNTGPYNNVSAQELAHIREKELSEAGKILGISDITFLDYKDGNLSAVEPGEIEDKVYRQLTRLSPKVVITFEPQGITNHPDHIKLTVAATVAFQKYARDMELLPAVETMKGPKKRDLYKSYKMLLAEGMLVDNEPKLYYACMPRSLADYLKEKKVIPAESFGKPWMGTPDERITTVIDVKKYKNLKQKAILAHRSQSEDASRFFSLPDNPLLSKEYFILRMSGVHEVFMGKNDRVANRL